MQLYLFTDSVESDELTDLAKRLTAALPTLQKLTKLDEVRTGAMWPGAPTRDGPAYIIYPIDSTASSLEPVIRLAEQDHAGIFYIFVSKEISASDYKRLIRSGGADWVSLQSAPQDILDVITSRTSVQPAQTEADQAKLAIAAFVPSGGGVGNTTLAVETAVQLKLDKGTRTRRVCLLDLDIQTSHICDYLDIEPRLRMEELADDPERLDAHLFDLFVSRHSSGIDVLASPRNRHTSMDLSIPALDALFRMISTRYDLLIIDLPPLWFGWTAQVISACDVAVVTGFNNISSLRQIAETLAAMRGVERSPQQVVVGLNRIEARLFGGIARSKHVRKVLGHEHVLYVRNEPATASHSVNTGMPITTAAGSSKISKDIRAFAALFAAVAPAPTETAVARSSPRTRLDRTATPAELPVLNMGKA